MNFTIKDAFKALEDVEDVDLVYVDNKLTEAKKPEPKKDANFIKASEVKTLNESKEPLKEDDFSTKPAENKEYNQDDVHKLMDRAYKDGHDLKMETAVKLAGDEDIKDFNKFYSNIDWNKLEESKKEEKCEEKKCEEKKCEDESCKTECKEGYDRPHTYKRVLKELDGKRITSDNVGECAKLLDMSVEDLYNVLDDLVADLYIYGNNDKKVYRIPAGAFEEVIVDETCESGKCANESTEVCEEDEYENELPEIAAKFRANKSHSNVKKEAFAVNMANKLAQYCNETFHSNITSDDIQFDENKRELYVEGKLLNLPVSKFGAYKKNDQYYHNGRQKDLSESLGKLFSTALRNVDEKFPSHK